jgi:CheY-like chemotaxis protein
MTSPWLEPGCHAVRFYDDQRSTYASIADFFSAGDAEDPLILVGRHTTLEAVTRLLASDHYGLTNAANRIHFVDAAALLARVMPGEVVDAERGAAAFAQILADVRRDHASGTVRLFGETVDVLCARGRVDAAVQFERLAGGLFELERRLVILCGYARERFHGAEAAHLSAICGLHSHAADDTGNPPAQGGPPAHGDPPPEEPESMRDAMVYVIDDDASIRRSVVRFLRLAQLKVRAFDSAEAFLVELEGLSLGFLVIDIQLGGMSGLDLLAHMQAMHPAWPALAMSGSHDAAAEQEAHRLGARAFLHKPFDSQALLAVIASALA